MEFSPAALEAATGQGADGRAEILLHLQKLHCQSCVAGLEGLLRGQADVQADLVSSTCVLRWEPGKQRLEDLINRLVGAGFGPRLMPVDSAHAQARSQQRSAVLRIGMAGLFGMQVMMLASAEYFAEVDPALLPLLRYAQAFLALPVLLFSGWPFLRDGLGGLRRGMIRMDLPVALAMSSAYGLSAWHTWIGQGEVYFDSVAMFVLLLSLARHWQARGQLAAADRLRRLIAAQPLTARRQCGDRLEQVACSELRAGDYVLVAPGEVLPADGVLQCAADVDESLLSGESEACYKGAGDGVLAGSSNLGQSELRMQVAATGAATVLSQITHLIQRAQLQQGAVPGLTDRIAQVLVPAVLLLAGIALYWRWPDIDAALAVLVVTCPCALSLALPMTLAAAVERLAGEQVLLVRPEALLKLPSISDVIFDKTGTLTSGRMRLVKVLPLAAHSQQQCLDIAARLESGLAHPVARAFAVAGQPPPDDRELLGERGVQGTVLGCCYRLGPIVAVAGPGQRWFELYAEERPIARFCLVEAIRPAAKPLVRALAGQGIRSHLLSGDQAAAVTAVAAAVGISGARAHQSPAEKLAALSELRSQGRHILAIGDGINDGPVLAAAHVAISMGTGSALAQAQGDLILLQDQLEALPAVLHLARRARRIVRQNLGWALAYNISALPLAFTGMVSPWLAALGMGASSLLVTLNALRLLRRRGPTIQYTAEEARA